jgi:hypothetical protein
MRVAKPQLQYEGAVVAFARLGVSYRFGAKLVERGILTVDALCGEKPLFLVDGNSLDRHRAEILSYQAKLKHIEQNVPIYA